jgi:hypothetical protein
MDESRESERRLRLQRLNAAAILQDRLGLPAWQAIRIRDLLSADELRAIVAGHVQDVVQRVRELVVAVQLQAYVRVQSAFPPASRVDQTSTGHGRSPTYVNAHRSAEAASNDHSASEPKSAPKAEGGRGGRRRVDESLRGPSLGPRYPAAPTVRDAGGERPAVLRTCVAGVLMYRLNIPVAEAIRIRDGMLRGELAAVLAIAAAYDPHSPAGNVMLRELVARVNFRERCGPQDCKPAVDVAGALP